MIVLLHNLVRVLLLTNIKFEVDEDDKILDVYTYVVFKIFYTSLVGI